jgi:hypothetical protein
LNRKTGKLQNNFPTFPIFLFQILARMSEFAANVAGKPRAAEQLAIR